MALSAEYSQFPHMDVEDYLVLDNTSKTAKYEYLDGELYMLAGGSPNHSILVVSSICRALMWKWSSMTSIKRQV
jgi:hypothetical protein